MTDHISDRTALDIAEEHWPEHAKLEKVKEKSQAIGEFLDFSRFTLCEWKDESDVPRWIDSRTGTEKTPQGKTVTAAHTNAIVNPEWHPEGYYPVHMTIEAILADWFGIDQDKLEQEKRQMLENIRKANERNG